MMGVLYNRPVVEPLKWCLLAACFYALLFLWSTTSARAEPVALELILEIDCSSSVELREYELQMRGLADAFRAPGVVKALSSAAPNGISRNARPMVWRQYAYTGHCLDTCA